MLGLETSTIREIVSILRRTYCGNVGVQYMHISSPDEKAWLQRADRGPRQGDRLHAARSKIAILKKLIEAEVRSNASCTSAIHWHQAVRPGRRGEADGAGALEQIIKRGGALGVQDIVIGMPHPQGRLNVLAAVMGKPYHVIFHEFTKAARRCPRTSRARAT